ncbi:autotransporter outer membrane beta-barrel domain-containing protein [Escherichia coli]|nr:autotransporter outer membrane beta-barrel domain-containing protein [Escherichia coli]
MQGGHLGHDNNGGIARGATPESSGSYGLVRLEGDLLRTEVAGMSVTAGVYGAAGHSSVDVKDDDGSRAGTVRDDAGSLGGYLNLVHSSSGLWADIVAQGTRHSMKASSDNNDFRARGRGWLGSLETGLPFSITDNLMLEPQLQYTWQGLSLDDGQDITVTRNSPTGQAMTADAEAAVSEVLRDLAFWLYRQLENEYDWLTSDAAVDEALLINEYTFTEAGLRAG